MDVSGDVAQSSGSSRKALERILMALLIILYSEGEKCVQAVNIILFPCRGILRMKFKMWEVKATSVDIYQRRSFSGA